jgi:ornithine--oxo-acid transaminase
MDNGLLSWLKGQEGRAFELHDEHVNPAFVKMLRTIGFDKRYVRGQGPYLWDDQGNKYLDLLTGWGVFALGRNHPKIQKALVEIINADLPNLVRMSCSPLSGLAAEMLTKHAGGDLSRVFFCNSGTETIEGALKFARCVTGGRTSSTAITHFMA